MREERRIVERRHQLLVAIPATVRDHLKLVGRAKVYWHIGTKGRATLTTTGRASSGRPRLDEDCPSCGKYRAELDRRRREMREGESATPGQFWRQGYMRALGDVGNIKNDVELALVLLKQLLSESRRGPGPAGAPSHPRPRPRPRRATETVSTPVLSLPPGVVAVEVPEPS